MSSRSGLPWRCELSSGLQGVSSCLCMCVCVYVCVCVCVFIMYSLLLRMSSGAWTPKNKEGYGRVRSKFGHPEPRIALSVP